MDHLSLYVADYQASKAFYLEALKPLGFELYQEFPIADGHSFCGLGKRYGGPESPVAPIFWIAPAHGDWPVTKTHFAFSAASHEEVAAFHAAALRAGGQDNGAPGPRPHYHPHFYGAFILDPSGNNIEACCHKPQ